MGTVKLELPGQRPLLSGQLGDRARFWRMRACLAPTMMHFVLLRMQGTYQKSTEIYKSAN